jgi:GNAT superfamily N-acetyltransferase
MDKWEVLSQEMCKENATDDVFLEERISPSKLEEVYGAGHAVTIERGQGIIGFYASWPTEDPLWHELGSLWVAKPFRGQSIGSELFSKLARQLSPKQRYFIVSHNPRVVTLAKKRGFAEATKEDWFQLAPYAVVCGPCDRDVEDKVQCPFRAVHTECRLFVR